MGTLLGVQPIVPWKYGIYKLYRYICIHVSWIWTKCRCCCTWNINTLEVNHHYKNGFFLLDDDKPSLKKRWFVNQLIKNGGWTSREYIFNYISISNKFEPNVYFPVPLIVWVCWFSLKRKGRNWKCQVFTRMFVGKESTSIVMPFLFGLTTLDFVASGFRTETCLLLK